MDYKPQLSILLHETPFAETTVPTTGRAGEGPVKRTEFRYIFVYIVSGSFWRRSCSGVFGGE